MEKTTIQLEKQTVKRISKLGKFHSTYDSILNELLDSVENYDKMKIGVRS